MLVNLNESLIALSQAIDKQEFTEALEQVTAFKNSFKVLLNQNELSEAEKQKLLSINEQFHRLVEKITIQKQKLGKELVQIKRNSQNLNKYINHK